MESELIVIVQESIKFKTKKMHVILLLVVQHEMKQALNRKQKQKQNQETIGTV